MKREATIALSVALAFGAFVCPHSVRASEVHTNQRTHAAAMNVQAKQEAATMVPATVDLRKELDARKIRTGDHFQAVLRQNVQLKNGPRLDNGTMLLGTVTTDQTNPGNTRLALRFTRAELKNGQIIPIKATVVDVAQPEGVTGTNIADETGLWSPHTLRVDQIGALSGIDMHSNIASHNSVIFVSKKKDDVKLSAGSQFVVAIAERPGQMTMRGGV